MKAKRSPNGQTNGQAMPMPGLHRVYLPDLGGKIDEYPESFYQVGTNDNVPGMLTVFHQTGMFTLASYAPGQWLRIVRVQLVTEPVVVNNVLQTSTVEETPA